MGEIEVRRVLASLFVPWMIIYNISFVYIGMLLAPGAGLRAFVLITVAFMSARLAALIMNRYLGRELDLKNRKKLESDASLAVPKNVMLASFAILAAVFIFSAYMLNTLALALSPVVILLFIVDPKLKKHSASRHFSVGAIESIDVLAGYIGVAGAFPYSIGPYILVLGMIFIGSGFDILYSIIHMDFDRKHGLKTYPVRYGARNALRISAALHYLASAMILTFAILTGYVIVIIGAVASVVALMSQHVGIDPDDDIGVSRRINVYNAMLAAILLVSVALAKFAA
jgi:4-hydroxybenzoate polyprenyltransferase